MFFLRMFAAIVRDQFPRLAVKRFIVKTNPNAALFLPGSNEELRWIEKLNYGSVELQEREWSSGTNACLLRQGNTALLSRISTKAEFLAVLNTGVLENVIAALRYYMPDKEMARGLLNKFGKDAIGIVLAYPAVFDAVPVEDVIGHTSCDGGGDVWQRDLLTALVTKRPSSWALKAMRALRSSGELSPKWASLFKQCFCKLNRKRVDISDMIDYLYFHFPDLYAKVRRDVHEYENLASYWVEMFSLFVEIKALDGHAADVQDFRDVNTEIDLAKLEDWEEAYVWLKIGYDHCDNERILIEIADNLARLKKQLNTFVYEQLFATVIDFAKAPFMLEKLLRMADTPFKPRLQAKLAEASGATPWLRDFFPFDEWEEETVKKAIKQMVGDGKFPVAEIAKLTEPLQQYAMKCMEVRSQMLSLKKDVSALLKLNIQLYPEVEMRLLRNCGSRYAFEYIEKHKIAEATFLYMLENVSGRDDNGDLANQYLFAYASRWKLTKSQYLAVMQSELAYCAPSLKHYLVEEEDVAA